MDQSVSEQMKADLRKLISEISEKSLEEIKDNPRFAEDLGIDSMMALEVG